LRLVLAAGLAIPAAAENLVRIGFYAPAMLSGHPTIHALKAYNGRIYAGYGDYDNHPAVIVSCYRPDTGKFHLEFSAYTDSIGVFREIAGKLYVPHIDPVHYQDFKDLSYFSDGAWRDMAPHGMVHTFDIATLTGTDLWCVGSKIVTDTNFGGAAVFRSTDGGRTWKDVTVPTTATRYYYGYAFRGKFYVQDTVYDENGVGQRIPGAGSSWLAKTRTIRSGTNELVLGLIPPQGPGLAFQGPAQIYGLIGQVAYDFAWDGTWIYLLKGDGLYRRPFPAASGEPFERMPIDGVSTNSRSLEIMDGVAYVADVQGYLWAGRLDGEPMILPPAPTVNELADEFGRGLAVDGNKVIVGSPGQFVRSILAGQASVWEPTPGENDESGWTRTAVIDPPGPSFSGWFGKDVAAKGDVLVIAETGRDATSRERGYSSQAHLYQRTPAGWEKRHTLTLPFIGSVATDGESLVVASVDVHQLPPPFQNFHSPRVSHYGLSRDSNDVLFVSAINRVFSGSLSESEIYEPTMRVVMESNVVAVGFSGDVSRFGGPGRVNVYERLPSGSFVFTDALQQEETAGTNGVFLKPDRFGFALALKNGWLAVGASRDDTSAPEAGAVHIYQRTMLTNGSFSFIETQLILPPHPQFEGAFGASLAMTDSRLIVGSPGTEVNGQRHHGSVYVYERVGTNWVLIGQMPRPENSTGEFGIEVAANENWLVAGSRFSEPSSNLNARVTVLPYLSPFSLWTTFHGLTGTDANPSSDPDNDGADNLAEYAYNLNPKQSDGLAIDPVSGTRGLPAVRSSHEGNESFVDITQLRRRNSEVMGLTYRAEVSADLQTWTTAGQQSCTVTTVDEQWERNLLRVAVPPAQESGFYRLKVELMSTQ
jgi:hypothetical protein